MNMTEFKSCPKCGGRDIYIGSVKNGVAVICFYCGNEGLTADNTIDAKDLWNQTERKK